MSATENHTCGHGHHQFFGFSAASRKPNPGAALGPIVLILFSHSGSSCTSPGLGLERKFFTAKNSSATPSSSRAMPATGWDPSPESAEAGIAEAANVITVAARAIPAIQPVKKPKPMILGRGDLGMRITAMTGIGLMAMVEAYVSVSLSKWFMRTLLIVHG